MDDALPNIGFFAIKDVAATLKAIPVIESQLILLVIVSFCHRWSTYKINMLLVQLAIICI